MDLLKNKSSRFLGNEADILFRNSSDCIAVLSTEGVIESVNPSFADFMAGSVEQWFETRFLNHVPEEERESVERFLSDVMQTPRGHSLQTRLLTPSGEELEVDLCGAPIVGTEHDVHVLLILRDRTDRDRLREHLREHAHQLAERVKELDCLYAISRVFEEPTGTFDDKMNAIASLLPQGWHYPEITSARIKLGDRTYMSSGFQETPWRQRSPITLNGNVIGELEVVYREERPPMDEGPFLREERTLIDSIAGRISRFYDRHIAHKRLEESEARYRNFINNIPISVCRTTPGPNGRVLMANTRMAEIFGYGSVEELKKIHASDLYRKPEQRGLFSQSMLDRGDVVWEEVDMQRRDGTLLRVRLSGSVIRNERGDVEYFDCFIEDITAKHRAEQEKAMLEEQLRNMVVEAIVTVSGDLRVLSLNDAAAALFSQEEEQLEGRDFRELCGDALVGLADTVERAMREGDFVRDYQRTVFREGVEYVYSINVTPLRSEKQTRGIVVVRDVTRIRDLEKQVSGRFPAVTIVGKSPVMTKVFEMILDVADTSTTVLVEGESGTGKELIASAIHHQSPRKGGPFVRVNCVALSETLLESELFGHVRGAFTGANRDKAGRFELAHGGTIFLDEIGDISPAMQQHLLRVLQEREIERVGSTRTIKVDVRVIAATNQSLETLVQAGRFREDLYYRLNVVRMRVPPLRERQEDIPLLLTHFLRRIKKRTGREVKGILPESMEILVNYHWPGNVRQLENALERAAVLSRDGFIHPDHLPPEIRTGPSVPVTDQTPLDDSAEKEKVYRVLEQAGWNRMEAAKRLGVSRSTLWRMMKKHNIHHPAKS